MKTLQHIIREYYLANINSLPPDKQFHMSTRLAFWEADTRAISKLRELKSWYVPSVINESTLLAECAQEKSPQTTSKLSNKLMLRQIHYDKYTNLKKINRLIFKVRYLKIVYGIDVRNSLYSLISEQSLDDLKTKLLVDKEAMCILSTHAINFIYIFERVLRKNDSKEAIPLQSILEMEDGFDLKNTVHISLYLYFYCHCIIGESNFYSRNIPNDKLDFYILMLKKMEKVIYEKYSQISLDNKLEFLVCARICIFQTALFKIIFEECEKSLSGLGNFIVDKLNIYSNSNNKSFSASEHRNLLYILASSKYFPKIVDSQTVFLTSRLPAPAYRLPQPKLRL